MNSFLIPVAVTAVLLASANVANAGSGCGVYKNYNNRVATAHHGYGYGKPQPYQRHYQGDRSHGGHTYGNERQKAYPEPNIVEVASAAGSFNILIAPVKDAGLADILMGKGPFTVFAPTDEAFAKLPAGTLEVLLADKAKLTQVLTYHVVPGKLAANAISGVSTLATAEGSELPVKGISIVKTDVMASNGVIHIIDQVLIPQS